MQMHLGLLGEIEFRNDRDAIAPLVRPNQRRLLAVLGCRYREPVSSEWLADLLELSPGGLRTRIRRVRQILGDSAVVTQASGYRLGDVAIDAEEFEARRLSASKADGAQRAEALELALGVWRGSALVEFAHEPWAAGEAARLNELRSAVVDDLVDSYLRLRRYSEAIALVEGEITQHPFRDRSRRLLMVSLASAGRTTEALRAFNEYRTFLIDETGIEPPAETRQLEEQIVAGTLDIPGEQPAAPGTPGETTGAPMVATLVATSMELPDVSATVALELRDRQLTFVDQPTQVVEIGESGITASFDDPLRAISFAEDVQHDHLDALPLGTPGRGLAIGIYSGLVVGDRYRDKATISNVGRILGAAYPGQILMSAATALLAGEAHGNSLRGRGTHRLHGGEVAELVELAWDPTAPRQGRLRTTTDTPTNLSMLRPLLIGRAAELTAIGELLDEHRLVSIIGPGGSGKSAVSIEAAAERLGIQSDGVFVAELASIDNPALLSSVIARALELRGDSVGDSPESLAKALQGRDLLLVLDNAEHLIDAVAGVVEAILRVDGPRLLVTSREWLDVVGERTYPLPRLVSIGASGRTYGAELFLANASAAGVNIDSFDDDTVEVLAQRLDHLPLALELAAGAAIHLAPDQILGSLDRGERLRETRRRNRSRRFTSVEEMLEGSFELLDADERSLLLTLAVFRGPTSLNAVDGVWKRASSRSAAAVLGSLVLRSLVATQTQSGEVMYRLLETVRDFALDRSPSLEATNLNRRAHRDWFLEWSAPASLCEQYGSTFRARRFEVQLANFREAMAYSDASNDGLLLHRQASNLSSLWFTFLHGDEGMTWFERSGEAAVEPTDRLHHLSGFLAASFAAERQVDMSGLIDELSDRCHNGDDPVLAIGAAIVGITRFLDIEDAFRWMARAEEYDATLGAGVQPLLDHLAGDLHLATGHYEQAEQRYRRAVGGLDAEEYGWWVSADLLGIGLCRYALGDAASGITEVEESLEIAHSMPNSLGGVTRGAVVRSVILSSLGRRDEARAALALEFDLQARRTAVPAVRAEPIVGVIHLALDDEDFEFAGTLVVLSRSLGLEHRSPWQRLLMHLAAVRLPATDSAPATITVDEAMTRCELYLQ